MSYFRNLLQFTNWQPILNTDDANESYELFQCTFQDRKPWITLGILTSISAKRRLEKKDEVHRPISHHLSEAEKPPHQSYSCHACAILLCSARDFHLGTVRKYGQILTAFLLKKQVQLIPPLNSISSTLLSPT